MNNVLNGGSNQVNITNSEELESVNQINYTEEMQDIKNRAIADGTFMDAPNGSPSKLDERQRLMVRTKGFKEWFGDWEKFARFSSKGFEFLVGVPGSGKSTYVNKLRHPNIIVVSPDNIRREMTGNISDQSKNKEVWEEVERRINENLAKDKYVILDATNVNTRLRESLSDKIKANNDGIKIYATIFDADPNESKLRIKKDLENKVDRSAVPDEVIDRMYDMYQKTLECIYVSEKYEQIFDSNDYTKVSKVVDENGEPLVIYHGGGIQFDTFEFMEKMGFRFGTKKTALRRNVSNPKPFFLNIKYLETKEDISNWVGELFTKELIRDGELTEEQAKNLADKIIESKGGEYGIIYENKDDPDSVSYIVFSNNQFKLASSDKKRIDDVKEDVNNNISSNFHE